MNSKGQSQWVGTHGASNSQGASGAQGPGNGTLKDWQKAVAAFGKQDQFLIAL